MGAVHAGRGCGLRGGCGRWRVREYGGHRFFHDAGIVRSCRNGDYGLRRAQSNGCRGWRNGLSSLIALDRDQTRFEREQPSLQSRQAALRVTFLGSRILTAYQLPNSEAEGETDQAATDCPIEAVDRRSDPCTQQQTDEPHCACLPENASDAAGMPERTACA